MTTGAVREDKIAKASARTTGADWLGALEGMREKLKGESELLVLFGDSVKGEGVRKKLVEFGVSLGIPGEVHLPGGLFEFARRDGHGAVAGSGSRISCR